MIVTGFKSIVSKKIKTAWTGDIVIEIINGTDTSWDGDTLTWNNAPSNLGVKIGEITLTSSDFPGEFSYYI